MRYEIEIIAVDLMLDRTQARELLVEISCFEGVDGVTIHTGLSYDAAIEKEGSNSEDLLTTLKFYINSEMELAIAKAGEVMDRVNMMHEIRENGIWFTLVDVKNIDQYN